MIFFIVPAYIYFYNMYSFQVYEHKALLALSFLLVLKWKSNKYILTNYKTQISDLWPNRDLWDMKNYKFVICVQICEISSGRFEASIHPWGNVWRRWHSGDIHHTQCNAMQNIMQGKTVQYNAVQNTMQHKCNVKSSLT